MIALALALLLLAVLLLSFAFAYFFGKFIREGLRGDEEDDGKYD